MIQAKLMPRVQVRHQAQRPMTLQHAHSSMAMSCPASTLMVATAKQT